ncbi:hypothetical protein PI125_g7709 [Phytophthora idaei]|nr:hypothetical protein PI125_g7709 [Phytophthora idaei]
MTPEVNSDLSAMHRFTSIYQDSSCDGAPTGVFVQLKNDCENQVASSGSHCADVYDDSNTLVGYVDEICREGRREEGFKELFGAQPFMAADYYNGAHCSTFENSVAHQLTGECEALYDGYSPFRSAIISISDGVLSWKRNEGNTKIKKRGELGCPGSSGLGYYDFEIPVAEINHCYTVPTMRGAFLFYNTTSEVKSSSSSSGSTLPYSHARIDPETGMKLPDAVLIQKVASGELRITFSPYCLDSIVKLAEECVALDPAARPGAPMVMFRLQTIMKEAFGEGYIV